MTLFDRFKDAFRPDRDVAWDRLRSYQRLADQVYEVEVELGATANPRALAILQSAKCLQIMADALVGELAARPQTVSMMSLERAELWYQCIPDLLVACRQEAKYPNSGQIALPVRLKDVAYHPADRWSSHHLLGLRSAASRTRDFLQARIDRPQFQTEKYKEAILYFQEARTRQNAGDAITGLFVQGKPVPDSSCQTAEAEYLSTLARYLLIAQGLEEPTILTYESIQVEFGTDTFGTDRVYTPNPESVGNEHTQQGPHMGGSTPMNFEQMQQQSNNIQQHNQSLVNQLQQLVGKVQQMDANEQNKQDIVYTLRELALSVRGLNQETMGLLQNMALYIQHLENSHQHAAQYQQQYPPQYQQQPNYGGGMFGGRPGGGFWDTLIRSAEMGAGFEIGADIIDDIFGGGFR